MDSCGVVHFEIHANDPKLSSFYQRWKRLEARFQQQELVIRAHAIRRL
jgi:hypothetical protein